MKSRSLGNLAAISALAIGLGGMAPAATAAQERRAAFDHRGTGFPGDGSTLGGREDFSRKRKRKPKKARVAAHKKATAWMRGRK